MASRTPWDIYARELGHLGHGYPNYFPEPTPERGEIRAGDVGYMNRMGDFIFMFNVLKPAGDPLNIWGVPPGYIQFEPSVAITLRRDKIQNPVYSSGLKLTSAGVDLSAGTGEFTASIGGGGRYWRNEFHGAFLLLSEACTADHAMYNCDSAIVGYMQTQISCWLEFAKTRLGASAVLEEKDILLIYGHMKSSKFALGAFSHSGSLSQGRIHITSGTTILPSSAAADFTVSSEEISGIHKRSGPLGAGPNTHIEKNQCVFFNYYSMQRRKIPGFLGLRIKAAAGYHTIEEGNDQDDDSMGDAVYAITAEDMDDNELEESRCLNGRPTDYLVQYILEHSNARVACATDNDLVPLFKDTGFPEDILAALEKLAPPVSIDNEGVGRVITDTPAHISHAINDWEGMGIGDRYLDDLDFITRGPRIPWTHHSEAASRPGAAGDATQLVSRSSSGARCSDLKVQVYMPSSHLTLLQNSEGASARTKDGVLSTTGLPHVMAAHATSYSMVEQLPKIIGLSPDRTHPVYIVSPNRHTLLEFLSQHGATPVTQGFDLVPDMPESLSDITMATPVEIEFNLFKDQLVGSPDSTVEVLQMGPVIMSPKAQPSSTTVHLRWLLQGHNLGPGHRTWMKQIHQVIKTIGDTPNSILGYRIRDLRNPAVQDRVFHDRLALQFTWSMSTHKYRLTRIQMQEPQASSSSNSVTRGDVEI